MSAVGFLHLLIRAVDLDREFVRWQWEPARGQVAARRLDTGHVHFHRASTRFIALRAEAASERVVI
jgi:hypothetical protein